MKFNIDEARRFSRWLEEETGQVMLDLRDTEKGLVELQSVWNDSKYDKYMRLFDESALLLHRFEEDVDKYVQYLRKYADLIEEFKSN